MRPARIEHAFLTWQASVLPMNYGRILRYAEGEIRTPEVPFGPMGLAIPRHARLAYLSIELGRWDLNPRSLAYQAITPIISRLQ